MPDIVVIGAGQAGSSLVARLRKDGHMGRITLVGEEAAPPYQRPPLSKAYLLGDLELERLYLRPHHFYGDIDVDLRLGTRVDAIDRAAQVVRIGGEALHYDALVLT